MRNFAGFIESMQNNLLCDENLPHITLNIIIFERGNRHFQVY